MFKRIIIGSILALASVAANASGAWTNVTVSNIWVYTAEGGSPNGFVIVVFSSNGVGTPSCASGFKADLVIDTTTAAGGIAAGIAMQAYMAGTTISADGMGTCAVDSGFETMRDIHF